MSEQSNEQLKAVFDSFDKDNSGYLDIEEVIMASKELGVENTKAEVESIFRDIDKNFDGQISFSEFQVWWKLGKDNKMERMVYLQLKALNLLKKAKMAQARYGTMLQSKYGDKCDKHLSIDIQLGEPEKLSEGRACIHFNDEEVNTCFEEFSEGLDLSDDKPVLVFKIKSENPDDAVGELEEKVEEVKMMLQQIPQIAMFLEDLEFSYGTDGDFVKMGVACNIPMVIQMMQMGISQFAGLSAMGDGKDINAHIDLEGFSNYSPKSVLESSMVTLNPQGKAHIQGKFCGELLLALLHKDMDKYCSIAKESGKRLGYREKDKVLGEAIGSLLNGVKVNMKFNKADANALLEGNPMMGQMKDQKIKDILSQFAPMGVQMIEKSPPMVKGFLELFYEHFCSEGGLMVHAPLFVFKYELKTEGFKELYEVFFPKE